MTRRTRTYFAVVIFLALVSSKPAQAEPAPFDERAFSDAQSTGRTIVLETYAFWCLPCRIQSPMLLRLQSQAPFNDVLILRIGEKAPHAVWKRFRLTGFGNLVIFKGRQERARGTPTTEDAVRDLLRTGL